MAITIIALPMMFDVERAAPVKVLETVPPRPVLPAVPQVPATPPQPLQQDPIPVRDLYALPDKPAAPSPQEQESVAPAATRAAEAVPSTVATKPLSAPTSAVPPAVVTKKPLSTPAPAGKLGANGVPQAWAVQVAAMSDQGKANVMIQQLRAKGFTAFSVPGKMGNANTVRVFIGPKLDKAQAMKIKQAVDQAMGLQTMVVPYSAR